MQTSKTGNRHAGKQVKRFRESIGMKQDVLAKELGTTQQNISNYEKQEELEEELFAQIAKAMGVSPEILRDFNAEASIFSIQEMKDSSQAIYNFNPIDKILEQTLKIEELYKELLKSERDKIEVLNNANMALQKITETLTNGGGGRVGNG
jgi:transcriptional regulator with XRE-family HTH domain